jgi:hemerythrin-like domain-containing protein
MPVEETLLGTWASLHREHGEIFVKINLLEKALVDMLQKNVVAQKENALVQQSDFLEAFKQGIVLHFAVEKEALFPELAKIGKKRESPHG